MVRIARSAVDVDPAWARRETTQVLPKLSASPFAVVCFSWAPYQKLQSQRIRELSDICGPILPAAIQEIREGFFSPSINVAPRRSVRNWVSSGRIDSLPEAGRLAQRKKQVPPPQKKGEAWLGNPNNSMCAFCLPSPGGPARSSFWLFWPAFSRARTGLPIPCWKPTPCGSTTLRPSLAITTKGG